MKLFNLSAAVLVATLSATSAFAENSGQRGPTVSNTAPIYDTASTGSVVANPTGAIVTYPTNADSVLNETAAQRGAWIGQRAHQ